MGADGKGWTSYGKLQDVGPPRAERVVPDERVTFRVGLVIKANPSSRAAIVARVEKAFAELREFGIELDSLVIGGGADATPQ